MKLELSENNIKETIELTLKFIEEPYFLNKFPEKLKNSIYTKLAKAYYLNGDYENAVTNLIKTGRVGHKIEYGFDIQINEIYEKAYKKHEIDKYLRYQYEEIKKIDDCTKDIEKNIVNDSQYNDLQ